MASMPALFSSLLNNVTTSLWGDVAVKKKKKKVIYKIVSKSTGKLLLRVIVWLACFKQWHHKGYQQTNIPRLPKKPYLRK